MDKTEQKDSSVVLHFSASAELEKNIILFAQAEKRSKSAMIRGLVEEAIDLRVKKLRTTS